MKANISISQEDGVRRFSLSFESENQEEKDTLATLGDVYGPRSHRYELDSSYHSAVCGDNAVLGLTFSLSPK